MGISFIRLGDVLKVYQLNNETVVYSEVLAIFHPLMGLSLKRGSLPSNSGCDLRISPLIIQKIARFTETEGNALP
jgi:hypothetical protein